MEDRHRQTEQLCKWAVPFWYGNTKLAFELEAINAYRTIYLPLSAIAVDASKTRRLEIRYIYIFFINSFVDCSFCCMMKKQQGKYRRTEWFAISVASLCQSKYFLVVLEFEYIYWSVIQWFVRRNATRTVVWIKRYLHTYLHTAIWIHYCWRFLDIWMDNGFGIRIRLRMFQSVVGAIYQLHESMFKNIFLRIGMSFCFIWGSTRSLFADRAERTQLNQHLYSISATPKLRWNWRSYCFRRHIHIQS